MKSSRIQGLQTQVKVLYSLVSDLVKYSFRSLFSDKLSLIPFLLIVSTYFLHNILADARKPLVDSFENTEIFKNLSIAHPALSENEISDMAITYLFKWLLFQPMFWLKYLSVIVPMCIISVFSLVYWFATNIRLHLDIQGWYLAKNAKGIFICTFVGILFVSTFIEEYFESTKGFFSLANPIIFICILLISSQAMKVERINLHGLLNFMEIFLFIGKCALHYILTFIFALCYCIPALLMKLAEVYYPVIFHNFSLGTRIALHSFFHIGFPVLICFLGVKFFGLYVYVFCRIFLSKKYESDNQVANNEIF